MDKGNKDLVSVIVRFYERTDYICNAIKSLLDQSYEHIQIVVVNDGSQVCISDFIKDRCPSPTVKVVDIPHGGLSAALNAGVLHADGDYLVFLDDDDLLGPTMIFTALSHMIETNADIVTVGYKYFSEQCDPFNNSQAVLSTNGGDLHTFIQRNVYPINSVLIRKKIVEDAGYFDENLEGCEDWDLWLRLIAKGVKTVTIQECLSFVRVHNKSMSRRISAMQLGRLGVLEKTKTYLSKELQDAIGLRRAIALRMIIAGWYLLLDRSSQNGRNMILLSAGEYHLFIFPALLLVILSYCPLSVLRKLTSFATLTARLLFRGTDPYHTDNYLSE